MNIFGVWLTISYKDFGFHFLLIKNKQYEIECSYAMNDSNSRFEFRIFWNKSCMHSNNNLIQFSTKFLYSEIRSVWFDLKLEIWASDQTFSTISAVSLTDILFYIYIRGMWCYYEQLWKNKKTITNSSSII